MLSELTSLLRPQATNSGANSGNTPKDSAGAVAFADAFNASAPIADQSTDPSSGVGNQTLPQVATPSVTDVAAESSNILVQELVTELPSLAAATASPFFTTASGKLIRFDHPQQSDQSTATSSLADASINSSPSLQQPLVLASLRDAPDVTEDLSQSVTNFIAAVPVSLPTPVVEISQSDAAVEQPTVPVANDPTLQTEPALQSEPTRPVFQSRVAQLARPSNDYPLPTIDVSQAVLPSLQDLPVTEIPVAPLNNTNRATENNSSSEAPTIQVATQLPPSKVSPNAVPTSIASPTNNSEYLIKTQAANTAAAQTASASVPIAAEAQQPSNLQFAAEPLTSKPTKSASVVDEIVRSVPQDSTPAAVSDADTQTQPIAAAASQSVPPVEASNGKAVSKTEVRVQSEKSSQPAATPTNATLNSVARPSASSQGPATTTTTSQASTASPAPQPSTTAGVVTQQPATAASSNSQTIELSGPAPRKKDRASQQTDDKSVSTLNPQTPSSPLAVAASPVDAGSQTTKSDSRSIADVTSKSARSTASEASVTSAESATDPTAGSLVSNPAPDAPPTVSAQFKVETHDPAPTHLTHQVVSAIQKAADEGPHLRIHLTPPALGSLIVDISRTENGVVARLEFSNSQAQQAAMQSLPDLQQALAQQGIKVDRIDVRLQDANQQFNRGREDQPRDQRDSQSRPDRRQEQPKQQSNQTEDEDNADSTT